MCLTRLKLSAQYSTVQQYMPQCKTTTVEQFIHMHIVRYNSTCACMYILHRAEIHQKAEQG